MKSLQQKVSGYEKLAAEAEKVLAEKSELPSPGLLNAQAIHDAAIAIINLYREALADKELVSQHNKFLEKRQSTVDEQIKEVEEKAMETIRRQSEAAKYQESKLNEKLHQAAKIINQREQTIKYLTTEMKGLASENSRLEKIEQQWLAQKQAEKMSEMIRKEKECRSLDLI